MWNMSRTSGATRSPPPAHRATTARPLTCSCICAGTWARRSPTSPSPPYATSSRKHPPPQGVKAYVTGGAAMNSDQRVAGDKGAAKATLVTLVVIALMLLFVYRSIVTTVLILLMVFFELGASRGIVAFLGNSGVIGLSTFATSLLTLIAIAAGTDYAIFLIGRYQEARGRARTGKPRTTPCFTAPLTWCWVRASPSPAQCSASDSRVYRGSKPWRCRAR